VSHSTNRQTPVLAMAVVLVSLVAALTAGMLEPRAARAADPTDDSDTELAKKTQNPVADLISIPLQHLAADVLQCGTAEVRVGLAVRFQIQFLLPGFK
jgi:hypothetical protein